MLALTLTYLKESGFSSLVYKIGWTSTDNLEMTPWALEEFPLHLLKHSVHRIDEMSLISTLISSVSLSVSTEMGIMASEII